MDVFNKDKLLGTTDIVGWEPGNNSTDTRIKTSCITTRNNVYLIGGVVNNEFSNQVITAKFKSTGVIDEWEQAEPLPAAIASAMCVKLGNVVYLIGGWNGHGNSNVIYKNTIDDVGRLCDWKAYGEIPAFLSDASVFALGDTLHIAGGILADKTNEDVQLEKLSDRIFTCPIDKENNLGAWTESTVKLPTSLSNFVTAVTSTRVYIVGGTDKVGPCNTVFYSEIVNNKLLSEFIPDKDFPTVVEAAMSITAKNRVWVLGGTDDSKNLMTVYTAGIDQAGVVEDWREGDELPIKASGCSLFVDNTSVNIVGADDGSATMFAMFDGWKEQV